ncbi:MAG: CoA transferase [Proteobacteria bacterium]|nr:CoA transferase [Pseudomonadota bacterium]
MKSPNSALAGVRVLDAATFLAAPFCGTILADFGAEVIKVEQPEVGDPLRKFGTPTECGDTLVWMSEARNKKSVTLDLRQATGAAMFLKLAKQSDVVLENFRPGTMEKWGLGWDQLRQANPRLVMLRVSAYGQDGPYRTRPGFARIAHAFSGLAYLAGEPGRTPVVPGSTSLADYTSGLWGAIGVMMALRVAEQTGAGQVVDIALYESMFRLLDELAGAYAKSGFVRQRLGPDTVNACPHSHYQSGDGQWVAIACTSDRMFARLAEVMGRPELAQFAEFATTAARCARLAEVNRLVGDWVGGLALEEVLAQCEIGEVPCSRLNSIADIFEDPQYAARENLLRIDDPRAGELTMPAALPRLSGTPAQFRHAGPALGADNEAVFRDLLKLDRSALAGLRHAGII